MEKEGSALKKKLIGLLDAKNGKMRNMVMLLLAGICLMIIVWPTDKKTQNDSRLNKDVKEESKINSNVNNTQKSTYAENLENRLESILSSMNGVGDVKVMITLKDNGENIVEKDKTKSSISDETGSQMTNSEETVAVVTDDSEEPYIKQILEPNVEGVIVCCTGGGNPDIVLKITEAVQALFDVPVHKIVVLESN